MRTVQRDLLNFDPEEVMNCEICRAEMATDEILNDLRCADCRRIRFEKLLNDALGISLIVSAGYLLTNLLTADWHISAASGQIRQ